MITEKNILLVSKNQNIILADICYKDNKEKKPIVLFVHGYKSFKDWGPFNLLAEHFASKGFIFVKFNFSLNGTTLEKPDLITDAEAFGKNNIEKEVEDLESVIDWIQNFELIKETGADTESILLLGHSRGAAVSIIKAVEDERIAAVACWGAISDFKKVWKHHYNMQEWKEAGANYRKDTYSGVKLPLYYKLYENYVLNERRFNIKKIIKKLEKPLLLVHGIDDEAVLYEQSLELKKLKPDARFELLPYTGHNFGAYHPYKQKVLPFDMQLATDETIVFFKEQKIK
jgi:dipeptidyl aminopeptidase/acylaminoacyl peptidase